MERIRPTTLLEHKGPVDIDTLIKLTSETLELGRHPWVPESWPIDLRASFCGDTRPIMNLNELVFICDRMLDFLDYNRDIKRLYPSKKLTKLRRDLRAQLQLLLAPQEATRTLNLFFDHCEHHETWTAYQLETFNGYVSGEVVSCRTIAHVIRLFSLSGDEIRQILEFNPTLLVRYPFRSPSKL